MRFGEVVAAFVTLEPGTTWTGPDDVLAHLAAEGLAKQKWPVVWRVVDALPMSTSGKVQKQMLRAQLAAGGAGPSST
jgi:acyl-CoA synthetase (AMP-forming)/AMP-acid ligase II